MHIVKVNDRTLKMRLATSIIVSIVLMMAFSCENQDNQNIEDNLSKKISTPFNHQDNLYNPGPEWKLD